MYNKVEGYILNLIIFITGVSCMGKKKKTTHYSGIGGQAVLEGVMMKNKDDYAVAIRKPNGEIEVEVDVYRGILHDSDGSDNGGFHCDCDCCIYAASLFSVNAACTVYQK